MMVLQPICNKCDSVKETFRLTSRDVSLHSVLTPTSLSSVMQPTAHQSNSTLLPMR